MNKSEHGFLKGMLITFGIINIIGIVWYSTTLSTITLVSGVAMCIMSFLLGFSNLHPEESSVFNRPLLIVFTMIGIAASLTRTLYDSHMLRDIFGALPHLLSLVLFVTVLKIVAKKVS